jgi:DNA-binding LytR/AlgR family response regulator
MNGQFPLGQINPFKYFIGLACFFAVLFTFMDEHNGRAVWAVFGQWLLQTNGVMALFIGSHLVLSRTRLSLTSWTKLLVSGCIATVVFTPFSLLIDVYIEKDTVFDTTSLVKEWLMMAPPAITCWVVVNLPWLMGINFNYSNKADFSESKTVVNNEMLATRFVQQEKKRDPITTQLDLIKPIHSMNRIEADTRVEDHNRVDSIERIDKLAVGEPDSDKLTSDLLPEIPIEDDFTKIIKRVGADNIFSLKSELHYLSVITAGKEQLILYSLKEAIRLLETQYKLPVGGQVHRSYWVNQRHVISLLKQGREGRLLLPCNYCALVSRVHMVRVKTWF